MFVDIVAELFRGFLMQLAKNGIVYLFEDLKMCYYSTSLPITIARDQPQVTTGADRRSFEIGSSLI